jgi:tRNA (cmo5U34)-methyltransferase
VINAAVEDLRRRANVLEARDQIFTEAGSVADFRFGERVAAVFDDMVDRSVPFYGEIQRMIGEMAGDLALGGTTIYDLGCSTGNTLLTLDAAAPPGVEFVGLDNSPDMLRRCREKISRRGFRHRLELRCADLNGELDLKNASMVVMVLTLQFIRPPFRETLIRGIASGLQSNGALVLVEKVLGEESDCGRLFIKYYHALKARHGYSALEIAKKREALENVLVPYKASENREMLLRSGFRHCEMFFKWYNFSGLLAIR